MGELANHLPVSSDQIAAFCRRHAIRRLSLFGSVLREDFGPESDVDFLVEFEQGKVPGLIRLAGMELELSEMLGSKADLRTPGDLSRHFRESVLQAAVTQYAA